MKLQVLQLQARSYAGEQILRTTPVLNLTTDLGINYLMGLYVSMTVWCELMKTDVRIQARRSISFMANFSQATVMNCSAVCMMPVLTQKMAAAPKVLVVMNG